MPKGKLHAMQITPSSYKKYEELAELSGYSVEPLSIVYGFYMFVQQLFEKGTIDITIQEPASFESKYKRVDPTVPVWDDTFVEVTPI